jgi:hypothetical protein
LYLGKQRLFFGEVSEAAPFLKRAFEIRLKAFGEKHPDVAESYNLMARLSELQGREEEAEYFYRMAIHLGHETMGTDILSLLICYTILGNSTINK